MNDPTKDTILRSAVEYCLRKETVSTNPEKYKTHEKFIDYMDDPDISEFGHWMHSNGFNCALTAISVDLKKIPSVTPSSECGRQDAVQWIPCTERLPEVYRWVLVSTDYDVYSMYLTSGGCWSDGVGNLEAPGYALAWMPLPERWKGGEDGKT